MGRVREKPKAGEGCTTKSVDVPESRICLCHRAAARVDESPPPSPAPMLPTKHSSSNELAFNHATLYTRDRCGVIYHVHRRDCVIRLRTTFRPPPSRPMNHGVYVYFLPPFFEICDLKVYDQTAHSPSDVAGI